MRVLAPVAGWATHLEKGTAVMAFDEFGCLGRFEGVSPPTPGEFSQGSPQSADGWGHVHRALMSFR